MSTKFERQLAEQLARIGDAPVETHPRLKAMSSMLKRVIEKAKTVQKGTDSQKKFSLQYTEFCQSMITGLPELEAVARTSFPSLSNSSHLSPVGFLSALAGCVSAGSGNTLATTYLESIGRSALHKVVAAAAKAEEKASPVPATRTKRPRDADGDLPSPTTANHTRKFSPRAVPSPVIVGAPSPLLHGQQPMSHEPIPAFSLAGTAMSTSASQKSKAVAAEASGSANVSKKLSSRPGLSSIMMPWTMPPPFSHGVVVERAQIERAVSGSGATAITQLVQQRSMKGSDIPAAEGAAAAARRHAKSGAPLPTILEICLAGSGTEMLQLWEDRENGLDTLLSAAASSPVTKPAAPAISPALMPQPHPTAAAAEQRPSFFPHATNTTARHTVPSNIVSAIFHFGVVATDAPFLHKT